MPMLRLQRLSIVVAALMFSAKLIAAEPQITFKVQASDTLIGLSNTVLVSPAAWREVAALNRLKNPHRITPGQELQIPLRLLRSQTVPVTLVSVSGDVRVGEAGGAGSQTAASVGMPIREGQRLQTGTNGSVVLEFADGSRMKLPPSSLAEVLSSRNYASRETREDTTGAAGAEVAVGGAKGLFSGLLRLLQGSVEVFATKVLRAKPLEVSTPTAVVGVRGTHYRVSYSEAGNRITRTEVLEGRVRTDAATDSTTAPVGVDVPTGYGAWLDASARPPATVPMLPAPDLGGVPARFERPLVRFALVGEAKSVRVQVASDAAFDRIASDLTVPPGADVRIAALEDGAWFLRARRLDAQGIEGFDTAARPFVLKARPEPPATSAPRPNAKQSVGAVEFQWAANLQAQQYHLQVARDAAFNDVVLDHAQTSGTRDQAELPNEGVYHWRIASIKADGDKGPFGDAQGFELRPNPAPPQGGVSGDSLQLNWSGRSGDKQQVELASDAEFTNIVARDELAAAQWNVPAPDSAGTYYFRYRSIEPDGFTTPYSSTLKIEVPYDWRKWLPFVPFLFLL